MVDPHQSAPRSFRRPLSHWAVVSFVLSIVLLASAMALFAAPGVPAYMDPRPPAPPSPFPSAGWLTEHLVALMAAAGTVGLVTTVGLVLTDVVGRERLPDQ